jgi:hypothetical protein
VSGFWRNFINTGSISIYLDKLSSLILDTGAGIEKITARDVSLIEKQEERGCI